MSSQRLSQPESTSSASWDSYWQTFERPDYVNYTLPLLQIVKKHMPVHNLRALEIGAGTGGNITRLAMLGAKVVAIDFSSAALGRTTATAKMAEAQVAVAQADARSLPFPNSSFDLVYHQGFLEHFPDPAALLSEQVRVLRPQGYLLVDVPQRYNLYTIYKHWLIRRQRWPYGGWEREFSWVELKQLLQAAGLDIVDAYGRGYYPRPLAMLRNAGAKLPRSKQAFVGFARLYEGLWRRFEESHLALYLLQCIGILARKRER